MGSNLKALINLKSNFLYDYAVLQDIMREYVGQVGEMATLLPKRRVKRALMDAGGHLLKSSFVTMDNFYLEIIYGKYYLIIRYQLFPIEIAK